MIMINHPDHVQHVLVDQHDNYDKDNFLYRAVRAVLREGLIGNRGGEAWHGHRRLMQPSFNRGSVAGFTTTMSRLAEELLRAWAPQVDSGTVVDVTTPLSDLALKIVLGTLFGVEPDERTRTFERNFLEVNRILGNFLRSPFPPLSWPSPSRNRLRALTGELDEFVSRLIRERLADGGSRHDLFTQLLGAVDEETGLGLTSDQLSHEVLAMIVAGYETSGNSIAWVFYQLAQHPDVQRQVQAEVDAVLDGRAPEVTDLPKLSYTRMVIDETLRLFTPAWQTMRHAIDGDVIGGYRIPRGSDIHLNFFALHRHPEFWPDPNRFDPQRFTPEAVAGRPRHAYQPFGSGPRHCIGKHFALAELHIVTVMLAQTFHVSRPEGQPPAGFAPLVTLHPKGGLHLRLHHR